MQAEVKGMATMVILLLRLQRDIATQSQSIPTITQYKKKPYRFVQLLQMFAILAESSIQRIEWQYAGSHQENASASKASPMITR